MTNTPREKKRILYVEDDQYAHDLVKFELKDYGIFIARDITDGLRQARQRYFDLYILDNWLPDGTGIDLCRRIREFDPHTPIVFLSSAAYQADVHHALTAGAQIYFTKPSDLDELHRAVEQLIIVASARAFEARLAVIAAIREELAIRSRDSARLIEEATIKQRRAEEKALRAKAKLAFLSAMGTRGDFARLWPSIYKNEVRSHLAERNLAKTSGR